MYNNTIYYILAALAVIYILISMNNRRQSKDRKSRKFMDSYERKNTSKKDKKED